MPMNKELKAKWVADLRRDDIAQTTGKLCDGTAHCCLGRLYEVAGFKPDYIAGLGQYAYDAFATGMPSDERLEEWGLLFEDADDLAGMNDRGSTFKQIADYIENNPDI